MDQNTTNSTNDLILNVFNRLESGMRRIEERCEGMQTALHSFELKQVEASSKMGNHAINITEQSTRIGVIDARLSNMEKWKWQIVGAGIVCGSLLSLAMVLVAKML